MSVPPTPRDKADRTEPGAVKNTAPRRSQPRLRGSVAPHHVRRGELGNVDRQVGAELGAELEHEPRQPEKLLLVAFDRMDVSKTGTISRQDIIDAASSLGIKRLNLKDVASWIAAHDEAGDGVLSFAEFKRMMARLES